jgi:hypothetical protein
MGYSKGTDELLNRGFVRIGIRDRRILFKNQGTSLNRVFRVGAIHTEIISSATFLFVISKGRMIVRG